MKWFQEDIGFMNSERFFLSVNTSLVEGVTLSQLVPSAPRPTKSLRKKLLRASLVNACERGEKQCHVEETNKRQEFGGGGKGSGYLSEAGVIKGSRFQVVKPGIGVKNLSL